MGDYRILRVVYMWLVTLAWLDRLLSFGVIGCVNVVDSDGIAIVAA